MVPSEWYIMENIFVQRLRPRVARLSVRILHTSEGMKSVALELETSLPQLKYDFINLDMRFSNHHLDCHLCSPRQRKHSQVKEELETRTRY